LTKKKKQKKNNQFKLKVEATTKHGVTLQQIVTKTLSVFRRIHEMKEIKKYKLD